MSGTAKTAGAACQCNRRGRNDEKKCSRAIVAPTLEDFASDAAIKLTAKELSTAEYRTMRKEITDRIAKAQRRWSSARWCSSTA